MNEKEIKRLVRHNKAYSCSFCQEIGELGTHIKYLGRMQRREKAYARKGYIMDLYICRSCDREFYNRYKKVSEGFGWYQVGLRRS